MVKMIFRRPPKYLGQYLLIPVRVILFFPLLVSLLVFVLMMKAYIASIGVIALSIVLGVGLLVDKYLWVDFSSSGIGELAGAIVFFPLWFAVAWSLGIAITWLGKVTGLSASGVSISKSYDWFVSFMFDAKYQESPYDLYGPTFPKPSLEDFNLIAEEYRAYNQRFSLRELEFIITVASGFVAGFVASYYIPERKFAIGIATALVVLPCVLLFERWYSRTSPYYERVRDYDKATKIYESIQTEIRTARINAEFEKERSQ